MKMIVAFIILLLPYGLQAQLISESEFLRRMDVGEDLMKKGNYEAANSEFLFILNNKDVLPANLAYFFGRNSYHMKQYKQSINWLNKYIQLKGTRGTYYAEAVQFLQRAEKEFLELNRISREPNTNITLTAEDYDCGGLEKMICPVCKGNGVIVRKGSFESNRSYQTCPYSNGESYLSCEDYNKFMRGELDPTNQQ